MRRIISFGPAFVVLLAAMVMLTVTPAVVRRIGYAQTSAQIVLARAQLDDDDILERMSRASRRVADVVRPSVVHVEADSPRQEGRRRMSTASGSGWVYDTSGHIVTNAHVLFGARDVAVQFADGRVVDGEIVGEPDPYTDIAVVKVDRFDGLFPAQRASGDQPQQGDRVFAFGSPFGFKFSMSQGIISGLGRNPQTANEFGGFTNFIQTDAAVNPGNSGGPLVDVKGRVIGMNVAIATGRDSQGTTEGQSAGISFAIPLATIESVVDQIIDKGTVSRGFMGIRFSSNDTWVTGIEGYQGPGVLVGEVTPGGPAASAGVHERDVITRVNGEAMSSGEVLRSVISSTRPGQTVRLGIWREGSTREIPVVLGDFPKESLAGQPAVRTLFVRYGLSLDNVPRLNGSLAGVIVDRVLPDSPAAEAGFRSGQSVLRIGRTSVANALQAYVALADEGLLIGRPVDVTVAVPGDDDGTERTETIRVQITR